jgi:fibronectin type 3 domain-containing protein
MPSEAAPERLSRHAWIGLLAAGLLLAGCDSSGVNGDGDEDSGDNGDGQTAVPAAPSGLEATPADGEVSLSWEAAEEAQTYRVYRDTESGVDASGDPLEEGFDETSYTDGTAENGTTYYYVVTGVAGEEGDPSGEAEGAPFAPASGLESTSGDSRVELSWEAAAGADAYNVYRDTESGTGASGSPLAEDVGETAFADETAENGTEYFYVVTSVNPNGEESAESEEAEGAPFAQPTGLEGTSGDSQIELSWEAAAGAETYNVYRSAESGVDASGSPLEEGISDTSYTDESAENGTTYYYVITSANPNGEESSSSSEVEKTPFADPPGSPGPPGPPGGS